MSIRYRLVLIMASLSILGVCVSSWLAHVNAEASLQNAAIRQLAGLRRTRAYQIESYFRTVRNHVISLSEDRMFVDAMREFDQSYSQLELLPNEPSIRNAVSQWYEQDYLPAVTQFITLTKPPVDYLPRGAAANWLQNHYVLRTNHADYAPEQSGSGAAYVRVHRKYDEPFRKLIDQFGYYDLLLVHPRDLRVLYSAAHNADFGTSLSAGPYRDTPLAKTVAMAMASSDSQALFAADFNRYTPVKGAPAAFVASPIFDGPNGVGTFVLRISTAEIDRVVSGNRSWEKDGLGKSGDVEIVGPDGLMRSTARTLIEHPQEFLGKLKKGASKGGELDQVKTFGTTILATKVNSSAVGKALEGQEGTLIEPGPDGHEQIVSFMPLKIPGFNWVVLAHMDLDEALAPVYGLRRIAIMWGLIAVLLTTAVAFIVTEQLLRPIKALLTAVNRIYRGDLSARVDVKSKDELGVLSTAFNGMSETLQKNMTVIEQKNRENEDLLLNILPGPIAVRLKNGETAIADSYSQATVLFADIVGFTKLSATREPAEILTFLNGLFTRFDGAAKRHGIEKIKTIGDAYMAVCGILPSHPDHVRQMVDMALEMLEAVRDYGVSCNIPVSIRVGINTGPVVAGVVGATKFIYDLWGDTVNLASRMESTGIPGVIQVSRSVYETLKDQYSFVPRGEIEVKGKGMIETWLLCPPDYSAQSGDDSLAHLLQVLR